jgi:hypothetical protein
MALKSSMRGDSDMTHERRVRALSPSANQAEEPASYAQVINLFQGLLLDFELPDEAHNTQTQKDLRKDFFLLEKSILRHMRGAVAGQALSPMEHDRQCHDVHNNEKTPSDSVLAPNERLEFLLVQLSRCIRSVHLIQYQYNLFFKADPLAVELGMAG